MMQVMLDNTPVPRMGAPSEVADLVAFLVSDGAGYLTGTDVLIDGGVSATIERMLNPHDRTAADVLSFRRRARRFT